MLGKGFMPRKQARPMCVVMAVGVGANMGVAPGTCSGVHGKRLGRGPGTEDRERYSLWRSHTPAEHLRVKVNFLTLRALRHDAPF